MNELDPKQPSDTHPPRLGGFDVLALAICWGGAAGVAWASPDPLVIVSALVAAYFLAKWIILKKG